MSSANNLQSNTTLHGRSLLDEQDQTPREFLIGNLLGEGGMASVYSATSKDSARSEQYAIKVLHIEQVKSPRGVDRFIKEAQLLASLSHPRIVSVTGAFKSSEGLPFIVMEKLTGSPLSNLIQNAKLTTNSTLNLTSSLDYLIGVASALHYLHNQRIIYCDLKPSNIMVIDSDSSDNPIKLVDFGIAQQLDADQGEGSSITGTSLYMSPEQIKNEALDGRSDIYSFGILAYELLSGELPFNESGLFNVTASHLLAKVPELSTKNKEVPVGLSRLVKVCMEKDREDRYDTVEEILLKLQKMKIELRDGRTEGGMGRTWARLTKIFGGTNGS